MPVDEMEQCNRQAVDNLFMSTTILNDEDGVLEELAIFCGTIEVKS